LIMISIAYSRTGALPEAAPVKAVVEEQPPKSLKAPAPKSESRIKPSVLRDEVAPPVRHTETRKIEEDEEVLSAPAAPAPAAVVAAKPEAKPARKGPELVPAPVVP